MNEDKKLKLIDFSKGIKQSEIQHNFNIVQDEINKERRAVAGPGISYGFNTSLNGFTLTIDEGCLIANNGSEVYIDKTSLDIDKPILIEKHEQLIHADEYNKIYLEDIPYAVNRETTADNVSIEDSGVSVSFSDNTSVNLSIASIDKNCITLNKYSNLDKRTVDVHYYTTYKRRDAVFIDSEYKLKYRQGTTSPSPSIPEIEDEEVLYMLGYLQIDGFTIKDDSKQYASIEFIEDFTSVRNVYTDSNNKLYLCGVPFDELNMIHFTEPKDPEENCLWYDSFSNELKIWRHTDTTDFSDAFKYTSSNPDNPQIFTTNIKYRVNDSEIKVYVNGEKLTLNTEFEEGPDLTALQKQDSKPWTKQFKVLKKLQKGDMISYVITRYDGYAEWVSINSKSYILAQERYIWTPEYINYLKFMQNHDMQHFFFDAEKNRNMLFTPGKNSIELLIDNAPVHSDQYEEITINDAIEGDETTYIRKQLINYYNFKNEFDVYKLAEDYENIGVGFKLGAPLDKKVTIEARVTHRVNSNPISKRFQRSATFVNEDAFPFEKYIKTDTGVVTAEQIFTCSTPYRYHENQLEVFVNGIKQNKDIDFIEYAEGEDDKGSNIYKFKILKDLNDKDIISYKITTSIYSYDNVQSLLENFKNEISNNASVVDNCLKEINSMKTTMKEYTDNLEGHIETLTNIESSFDSRYLAKNTKIDKDNMADNLYEGIVKNVINTIITITKSNEKIDISDILSAKDFVLIIDSTNNRILCRDIDYSITVEEKTTFLNILTSSVNVLDKLCISGIKFNQK